MTFRKMFPSTDDAEVRTHVGGRRTKTIATPKNVHLLVFLVVGETCVGNYLDPFRQTLKLCVMHVV
jgi:hypothetical protein